MLDETVAKHAKVLIDFTEPGNCRYDDDNALGALSFFIDWTLRQEQHDACEETPSEPHGPHPPSASSSISGPTTTTTITHAAFVNAVRTTATSPPLFYTSHVSSLLPWMNTLMQSGVVAAVARLLGSRAATQAVHPARTASTSTPTQTRGGEVKQRSSAMVSREIQSEAMEFITCLMEGRSGNCLIELLDTSGLLVALLARLDAECKDEDNAAESPRSSQDGEVRESEEWCEDKSRSSSNDVHEASHCNRAKSDTGHNNASIRNDRPQSYLPALHFTIRLLLILQDIFRAVSSATLVSRFGFIASSTLMRNLMRLALQSQSRQAMRVSGKWAAMQRQLCVQALRLLQLLCTRHMSWLQCTEKEEQYEQDKWHYVEQALLCLLREGIEQEDQQDTKSITSSSLCCYHLQSAQAEVMMQALQTIQGMLIVRARRSSSRHNSRADTITTLCTITECASLPWSRRGARDGLVETIARLLRCQVMPGQDSVALCGVQTEALRVLQALLLALTEEHSRHANSCTNCDGDEELMAWVTKTSLMQTCVLRLRATTCLLHSVAGHTQTTTTTSLECSQDKKCSASVTGGCCRREVEVALRVVRFVYVLYTQLSCEASSRVSDFTRQQVTSTMGDIHTVLVQCQLPSTLAAFVAAMHAAGQFTPCEALGVLDMVAPQHDISIGPITRNHYRTPSPQPTSTSSSLPITPQPSSSSPQRPVACNVIPCLPAARDTLVAEDAMTRLLLLPVHDAMQLLLEWLSRLQPTEQVDGTLQRERAACRMHLIPYVTAFLASCLSVGERGCLPSCIIARLVTCMRVLRLSWAEEDDAYSNRVMSVQYTQIRQLRLLLLSVAGEQGCHIANTETEQRHIVQEALDLMHTIVSRSEKPLISEDRSNAWQEVQAVERLLRWHCVSCLSNAERVAVQHMSTLWQAQRTTTTNTMHGYGDTSDLCAKGCERLVHDLCACAVPFASSADEANCDGDAVDDMRSRPCDDTWQKYTCHDSNKVAVGRSICDLTACETGLLAYGSRLPRVLRLLHTLLCCGERNAGLHTASMRMEWFMSGAGCLLCALVHHCSAWLVHSTATHNYRSDGNIRSSGYTSLQQQSTQYNELPQSLLRLPETPFAAHDCSISSSGGSNSERHQRGTQNSKTSAAECDTDDGTYCVAWLFATAVRLLAMLLQPSYSKAVTHTRSIRVGQQGHSSSTIHKQGSAIERCMRMTWHDAQEKTVYRSYNNENDEAALVCARELTRCWLRNTPWLPLEDSLLVKRCRADEVTELRQAVSFVRELVTP